MIDAVMISEVIRIDIGEIVETGYSIDKVEVDQGMKKIIEDKILEVMKGCIKILKDKTVEESTEMITEMKVIAENRDRNRSRERSFPRDFSNDRNNRSTSNSRSRSGSRTSSNRDRFRCYKCREYDHFAKECPTSREERQLEQLQQMLNLDDEQTLLKLLATNTHGNLNKISVEEDLRQGHLNL